MDSSALSVAARVRLLASKLGSLSRRGPRRGGGGSRCRMRRLQEGRQQASFSPSSRQFLKCCHFAGSVPEVELAGTRLSTSVSRAHGALRFLPPLSAVQRAEVYHYPPIALSPLPENQNAHNEPRTVASLGRLSILS